MTKEDIQNKVIKVTAEKLGLQESQIKPESSFNNDLGADSLDKIDLLMSIEDEFNIEIPEGDSGKFSTIENAVMYLVEKVGL